MLKIGKINVLEVVDQFPFGFYLFPPQAETKDGYDPEDAILLPAERAPESCKIGDLLDVFVYHDKDDRLVANPTPPVVQLKEVAMLTCKRVTDFGAFVDWGLEKDLLVPSAEQRTPMDEGLSYAVYVFQDRYTKRLAGSTKLHKYLKEDGTGLNNGQAVTLLVSGRSPMGFKCIVDNRYLGLLHSSEVFGPVKVGDTLSGFVKYVREDKKIDLSLQLHNDAARKDLADLIMEDLEAHGGVSTLTDKATPEEIKQRFNVSKGAYKKALGALYKSRKINLDKNKITQVK